MRSKQAKKRPYLVDFYKTHVLEVVANLVIVDPPILFLYDAEKEKMVRKGQLGGEGEQEEVLVKAGCRT